MATSGTILETDAQPAFKVSATSASYPHSSMTSAMPALVARSSSTISTFFIFLCPVETTTVSRPYHVPARRSALHRTSRQSIGSPQEQDQDCHPDRCNRTSKFSSTRMVLPEEAR